MDAQPVELLTRDGTCLRGEQRGRGASWAVLVHDEGSDLDSCRPLVDALARADVASIAVDLRGHGASDGDWDRAAGVADVDAAMWAALASGAHETFLVAAGRACELVLAGGLRHGVAAMALLSPQADPARLTDELMLECAVPKLIVLGGADAEARAAAEAVERRLIGPRLRVTLPTERQGADLLVGPCAAQALSHTVGFLVQNRCPVRWSSPTASSR
jgi:pimeloyl-ACP methyl ester carboxylesterase